MDCFEIKIQFIYLNVTYISLTIDNEAKHQQSIVIVGIGIELGSDKFSESDIQVSSKLKKALGLFEILPNSTNCLLCPSR